VNPYTFADNDPINGSDPSGLFSGGIFGRIGSTICGKVCEFIGDFFHAGPSKVPHAPPLRGVSPGNAHPKLFHEEGIESTSKYFLLLLGPEAEEGEVAAEALGSTVNLNAGVLTADEALSAATQWLGDGYKEIDNGVFRSADNLRQFRMTRADIAHLFPHVHFEAIAADGRTILENAHIYLP
jgi:hypothetical protein